MTTRHRQILLAMQAVLLAAGVANGSVYCARTRSINAETPHAVVLRLERSGSEIAQVMGGPTTWGTLVHVECYGRIEGGEPDAASDEIVEAVFAALDADPTLAGNALDLIPAPGDTLSWDYAELDAALGCTTAKFIVMHQTRGRTLTL